MACLRQTPFTMKTLLMFQGQLTISELLEHYSELSSSFLSFKKFFLLPFAFAAICLYAIAAGALWVLGGMMAFFLLPATFFLNNKDFQKMLAQRFLNRKKYLPAELRYSVSDGDFTNECTESFSAKQHWLSLFFFWKSPKLYPAYDFKWEVLSLKGDSLGYVQIEGKKVYLLVNNVVIKEGYLCLIQGDWKKDSYFVIVWNKGDI